MTAQQPSYDLSYHFDANLRDLPNSPAEMRAYTSSLEKQLGAHDLPIDERLRLLGTVGVYLRMLGDLDQAARYLESAITVAGQANNRNSHLANSLRLAHVYQWQGRFDEADAIFIDSIARCCTDPDLHIYLDFAYQHYGKSLFDQGRFDAAERAFTEALILRQAKGDDFLIESTAYALEITRSWLGK